MPLEPQVAPTISETAPEQLSISKIRRNGGTQPRSRLYENIVEDYKTDMLEGAIFPPVIVYYDGQDYWLADGFHRVKASEEAGFENIAAIIKHGSRRDAVLYSVGANAIHGLRRTVQDKRRSIVMMLSDAEWCLWSNREIARQCAVSEGFVRIIKTELSAYDAQSDTSTTTSNKIIADTYERYGVDTEILQEAKERVENLSDERLFIREGKRLSINTAGLRNPQTSIAAPPEADLPLLSGLSSSSAAADQSIPPTPGKRKRARKEQESPVKLTPDRGNILGKFKEILPGQLWQLGEHYLYCGEASDPKFQRRLPRDITLALSFRQDSEAMIKDLAIKAKSSLNFWTSIDDFYLGSLRSMVQHVIEGTTDEGDAILMHQIPDPALFLLFEQLGCRCYCAESDVEHCNAALAAWTATQKTARRVGS